MFGVLVVVLGRYLIARLDFGLGQCQITFIVFFSRCGRRSVLGVAHSMTTAVSGQQMTPPVSSVGAYSCSSFGHSAWLTPW
jgi:hypothetical protein